MRKVLVFLTSSYPFGPGEPFIANEIAYLSGAFDEVVIISNDTEDAPAYLVPAGVDVLRVSYELSDWNKALSAFTVFFPEPRDELRRVRQLGLPVNRRLLSTVLVSWGKGLRFSRLIRKLARERPDAQVYAYSYWANDMAVAAAIARRRGWVHKAICRAHRWDVYSEPADASFLPFRHFLATHLDRYLFISEDGLEYFKRRVGKSYASLGCSKLGTARAADAPLSRQNPFVVMSCSNLIPRKRVERIAESMALVMSEATWIHIGEGPTRREVETICARLPRNIHVELMGQRSNSEVLDIFKSRHPSVFINLSDSEGVPVSIMEAMSVGVPVIATDVGGVGEIVSDGKNGRLFPPDPAARDVAAALEAFAAMPDSDYQGFASRAFSTWNDEFNADTNYKAFLQALFD